MKSFTLDIVKKIASALAIIVFLFGVVSVRVQSQDTTTSAGRDSTGISTGSSKNSPLDKLRGLIQRKPEKVKDTLETKKGSAVERLKEKRGTVKERVEEKRSKLQEKRDELREKAKERQEEKKQKIEERRAEKIKEFTNRMRERMLAMVERMETLSGRIESRMDKLKEKGADTGEAQAQLDDAKSKLAAVKARISSLVGVGADIAASDNPKDLFSAVKEEASGIKKDLVEVHKLLASSMGKVKGLSSVRKEGGINEKAQ